MRHYSKLLGLRTWTIVRRPVWRWVVGIGAFYSFLQLVAHYFAERLVSIFDALFQWWYVPISIILLCVLLRAGYELWNEAEQGRKKEQEQRRASEQECENLQRELREARARVQDGPRYDRLLAEFERVRNERDDLKDALREQKNQRLQDERRKRIEEWRSVICNFDFEAEKFGATGTYSQMRPYLHPETIKMFEAQGITYAVSGTRGHSIFRNALLDEVARTEKEWGLI